MGKEELVAIVKKQKEQLNAGRGANVGARSKGIVNALRLCIAVMGDAAKAQTASRVICFAYPGLSTALSYPDWKLLLSKLTEIGYTAEFTQSKPEITVNLDAEKFAAYQEYYPKMEEQNGDIFWHTMPPIPCTFAKVNGAGDIAIRVSLEN
jgi:hypothetical protein